MTRKLEELFDLEDVEQPTEEEYVEGVKALDEIEQQLPASQSITDLSTSDQEMDDLASKAVKHYDDLMDLGMNVEPRFSAPIFDAASKLLGHAITAKNAKINKKLKMIELQLKKARLDQQEAKNNGDEVEQTGTGHVLDRNELLKRLLDKDAK